MDKFFPFREYPFRSGLVYRKANRKSRKVSPLSETMENLPSVAEQGFSLVSVQCVHKDRQTDGEREVELQREGERERRWW